MDLDTFPAPLRERLGAGDAAAECAGGLRQDPFAEDLHSRVNHMEPAELLRRRLDLRLRVLTLEEDQLTPVTHQGCGQRQERPKGTDRACGDGIENSPLGPLFRSRTHDLDVRETELVDLLRQPRDTALHRLDKDPVHVGARDRQHDSRKARSRTDVAHPACGEQRRSDDAVQHMTRPQPGEFQGTDEASLLAVIRQRLGELPGSIDLGSEQSRGDSRLRLEGCRSFGGTALVSHVG